MQVSFLVNKMKEESRGGREGPTRERLRNKIASLSQSHMRRATDALVMIWNGVKMPTGPLEIQPRPRPAFVVPLAQSLNWYRTKLALLKSIKTGVFIDIQFYAYNKILDGSPLDLKPLFTSSVVIGEWGAAISTRRLEVILIRSTLTSGKRNHRAVNICHKNRWH